MIKTSLTHPLEIATIPTQPGWGNLGVTFAPGKKQKDAASRHWDRDLDLDLDDVKRWGAAAVVTLLEPHEFEELKIHGLGEAVTARGIEWLHWPIKDVSVPDADFQKTWPEKAAHLRSILESGRNVLFHCKGGLGRAGMVAARLLVELGKEPNEAIRMVRTARSEKAIETADQEDWVHTRTTSSL